MVGRGLQIKPIKSIRAEDGKYKYSDEQKAARNAKDRARRLKLKIKGLEDANSELKKANTVLTKAVARQEKKAHAKKDTMGSKPKKAPKEAKEASSILNAMSENGVVALGEDLAPVVKAKKAPRASKDTQPV